MTTVQCGKLAVAVFVWPSMKVLPCCQEHAEKIRAVADALGSPLGELVLLGTETCTQQVKEIES